IYSTHHVLNTDPRGTSLFTLLLHDALPISCPEAKSIAPRARLPQKPTTRSACVGAAPPPRKAGAAYAETKNIIPRARLPPSQAPRTEANRRSSAPAAIGRRSLPRSQKHRPEGEAPTKPSAPRRSQP